MVISMGKPNWILEVCSNLFYSDPLHMALECKDTKLWALSFCEHHNVSFTLKGRINNNQLLVHWS
jgi:hypothetical protein